MRRMDTDPGAWAMDRLDLIGSHGDMTTMTAPLRTPTTAPRSTASTSIAMVAATASVGLSAGVLFCYQVAVMPGLASLDDRGFVTTFQSIDRAIVGPVYLGLAFFGAAAALGVATAVQRGRARALLGLATAIYLVGVVGVTMAWHVPHNDALKAIDVATSSDAALAAAREGFEGTWTRLNLVRTVAATASLALVARAATVARRREGRVTSGR